MLYMVIERFANANAAPIGERFRQRGRMLPAGVRYIASWIDTAGTTCFQVMEAADAKLLDQWIEAWDDLASFEVTPIVNAADFWASFKPQA